MFEIFLFKNLALPSVYTSVEFFNKNVFKNLNWIKFTPYGNLLKNYFRGRSNLTASRSEGFEHGTSSLDVLFFAICASKDLYLTLYLSKVLFSDELRLMLHYVTSNVTVKYLAEIEALKQIYFLFQEPG